MSKKYYCEKCNFSTNDKYNMQRHKKTKKHKEAHYKCEYCKKGYKFRSGLSRHLLKCKKAKEYIVENNEDLQKIEVDDGFCINISNNSSNLVIKNKNNKYEEDNIVVGGEKSEMSELIKIIKAQQRQLDESHQLIDKVIKETVPRIGNNNNNNISINVYLNKECKNAMNLTDFVDQINVSIEDLVYTQQHGYAQGITNLFTKQLKDLSPSERPIHCSDTKRLQFYVKDDNTWMKDDKHIKLDKSLNDVKIKQMKKLKQWEDLHPDYLSNESLLNKWQLMVKEIIGDGDNIKEKEKNITNIKKTIATNTLIPQKYSLIKNK